MSHIKVHEEYARVEFFGRFDLRINRLINHLAAEGLIKDTTDRAFAESIGRQPQTVNFWRNLHTFPNSVSLMLIAKKFGVSIDWMCGFYGNALSDCYRDKVGPAKLTMGSVVKAVEIRALNYLRHRKAYSAWHTEIKPEFWDHVVTRRIWEFLCLRYDNGGSKLKRVSINSMEEWVESHSFKHKDHYWEVFHRMRKMKFRRDDQSVMTFLQTDEVQGCTRTRYQLAGGD